MNAWECAKCHAKYKPTPSLDSYEFAKSLMPLYDVSNFVDEMPDIDDAAVEISEYVNRRTATLREALERIADRCLAEQDDYSTIVLMRTIARAALLRAGQGEEPNDCDCDSCRRVREGKVEEPQRSMRSGYMRIEPAASGEGE